MPYKNLRESLLDYLKKTGDLGSTELAARLQSDERFEGDHASIAILQELGHWRKQAGESRVEKARLEFARDNAREERDAAMQLVRDFTLEKSFLQGRLLAAEAELVALQKQRAEERAAFEEALESQISEADGLFAQAAETVDALAPTRVSLNLEQVGPAIGAALSGLPAPESKAQELAGFVQQAVELPPVSRPPAYVIGVKRPATPVGTPLAGDCACGHAVQRSHDDRGCLALGCACRVCA